MLTKRFRPSDTCGTRLHDCVATMLHLLGFHHTRLTYRHARSDFRLSDVFGEVVKPNIA